MHNQLTIRYLHRIWDRRVIVLGVSDRLSSITLQRYHYRKDQFHLIKLFGHPGFLELFVHLECLSGVHIVIRRVLLGNELDMFCSARILGMIGRDQTGDLGVICLGLLVRLKLDDNKLGKGILHAETLDWCDLGEEWSSEFLTNHVRNTLKIRFPRLSG